MSTVAVRCLGGRGRVNVTVMGTLLSLYLLLMSRTSLAAVPINTNGWHGCEELKSRSTKRVRIATNFATRIRSCQAGSEPPFTHNKPAIPLHSLQRSLGTPGFREISKS